MAVRRAHLQEMYLNLGVDVLGNNMLQQDIRSFLLLLLLLLLLLVIRQIRADHIHFVPSPHISHARPAPSAETSSFLAVWQLGSCTRERGEFKDKPAREEQREQTGSGDRISIQ
eukprot:758538-Hanusia_phi.AAC.2